jgi:hypothetical protein
VVLSDHGKTARAVSGMNSVRSMEGSLLMVDDDPASVPGDVASQFRNHFLDWKIRLPAKDLKARRPGRLHKAGWAIWYLFGRDERGEYVDYYASHRMTEDSHVRLRSGICSEHLPVIFGMRRVSPDPDEDARWEAAHMARNREIARMLDAKGFGVRGDEPGGVLINRFLRLGGLEDDD